MKQHLIQDSQQRKILNRIVFINDNCKLNSKTFLYRSMWVKQICKHDTCKMNVFMIVAS